MHDRIAAGLLVPVLVILVQFEFGFVTEFNRIAQSFDRLIHRLDRRDLGYRTDIVLKINVQLVVSQFIRAFFQKEFLCAEITDALQLIGNVLIQVGCVQFRMNGVIEYRF